MDLIRVEELAGLWFSKEEIRLIMGDVIINDLSTAMLKGQLQTEYFIRNKVLSLAKEGSIESIKMMQQWQKETRRKELN